MTCESLHKIKIFPRVNSKKKRVFSNSSEESINDGWNEFIMEYNYWFPYFSMIYIYIYIYIYMYIYIYIYIYIMINEYIYLILLLYNSSILDIEHSPYYIALGSTPPKWFVTTNTLIIYIYIYICI